MASTAGIAQAQTTTGTAAGTTVNNTASVTYTVNGTDRTTDSTTATFVVDRKVNFTVVTDQTGYTQVNLGEPNVVTKFKVTNTTNDVQDFLLDPDQTSISLGILPGTDNFNVTGLKAYVDVDGDGRYDPNVDTSEFIDELAPDASATVFIVGNVPTTVSAAVAWNSLHVIVAEGGAVDTKGDVLVSTDLNLLNADTIVDVVFADDGTLGDLARNGRGRAYSGYEVGACDVALTVAKFQRIVADGINPTFFRAIPGATIEYCLIVSNATLLPPASNVVLTDAIPADTTYVPGSLTMGAAGVPGVACVLLGSTEDDDADDEAENDGLSAAFDGASKTVAATIATVRGGTSLAAAFKRRRRPTASNSGMARPGPISRLPMPGASIGTFVQYASRWGRPLQRSRRSSSATA